jgi:hypothetical protein
MAIVSFRYSLSRRAVLLEVAPLRADALQSTHSIADRFGMARALVCVTCSVPEWHGYLIRQP